MPVTLKDLTTHNDRKAACTKGKIASEHRIKQGAAGGVSGAILLELMSVDVMSVPTVGGIGVLCRARKSLGIASSSVAKFRFARLGPAGFRSRSA
jgi:hypothetical protein